MSFAEEVSASNLNKSAAPEVVAASLGKVAAPEPAAPKEPKAAVAPAQELEIPAEISFKLPTGSAPVEETAKVAPELIAEPEKPKIRIGGVEFDTVESAVKYADTLALAKQQEDAYREGYSKAKDESTPKTPEKAIEEIIEEEFFKDPKVAIAKIMATTKQQVFDEYNKMINAQAKVQQQKATADAFWDNFYKEHTDLSDPETRKYVQNYLVRENWNEWQTLSGDKATKVIAETARRALKIKKEDSLPSIELQSRPAIVPGGSGEATNSSVPATKPEMLDFVSQVNKLRRRAK